MDKKVSELDAIGILETDFVLPIAEPGGDTQKVSIEQLDTRYAHVDEFGEINAELANQPKDSFIASLLDAGRRPYNWAVKGNTTNKKSTDHFYFIDGDPEVDSWKARLAAVFRLSAIGQDIIHDYGAFGQVTPTDGGNMKLDGAPSGVNIVWDNGSGGATNYWYDVAPGDLIVNTSLGNAVATIASWGLKVGSVTNSADIVGWLDNHNIIIINGQVSGLFHFHTGWTRVFDTNATSKLTMRSSSSANKLRFQSMFWKFEIMGKKGPSQGNFDLYNVTDSDAGVLVSANISCANGSNTYNNLLYTYNNGVTPGEYSDLDYKLQIFELRPTSSSPVDIEYIKTYLNRSQAAANSCAAQENFLWFAPVAVAQRDLNMIENVIKGIKSLIYNNIGYASGTANRPWSDYYYLGRSERLSYPSNGVGAPFQTSYSTNPVYATYFNQPVNTRAGFVMSALGQAYVVLQPFLSAEDNVIFQDALIRGNRHIKSLSAAWNNYALNASVWFYNSFLHRHQVALDLEETVATFVMNGAINNSVTSIVWDSVTGMEVGDVILVGTEKIGISQINPDNNTAIVVRGVGGTTKASHSDNDVGTALNWKELAAIIWYHIKNGNPGTTNAEWIRYVQGSGLEEETDIAFGVELPSTTTTNGTLLSSAGTVVVTSASNIGFTSGAVLINTPLDVSVRKDDNTYEFMQAYYSATNTISVDRAKYGSTAQASLATAAQIGRYNDWSYGRLIPSLLAWAYFLAEKYSSTEKDEIRKAAKAIQRMAEKRLDLDTGEYVSYGGSRLPGGGAVVGELGALYGIFHAMNEGIDYYKLEKFYEVYAKDEIEQFGFIADAERGTGSDNANRELGAPITGMLYSIPIAIKLINSNINT